MLTAIGSGDILFSRTILFTNFCTWGLTITMSAKLNKNFQEGCSRPWQTNCYIFVNWSLPTTNDKNTLLCLYSQQSETVALECLSAPHSSSKSGRFPLSALPDEGEGHGRHPLSASSWLCRRCRRRLHRHRRGGRSVCKLGQLCVCTELQLCVGPVRASVGQPRLRRFVCRRRRRRTTHRRPGAPLCVLSPARRSESWSHQVRRVDGPARAADLLHLSLMCVCVCVCLYKRARAQRI